MDFKALCNSINKNACVISVEKKDDSYGEIRLVEGNDKYIESFEKPQDGINTKPMKFIPNSIYTDFIGKNLNFELFCYRAAIKKELLHSYAYPENFGAWFHMIYIPLDIDDPKYGYCLYVMDINLEFDSEQLSSATNGIANRVLKTTLQLSNTTDFKASLKNVIKDIREMCNAAFCCVLLIDEVKEELNVLAEDRDNSSDRLTMDEYMDEYTKEGFYNIVKSWSNTIGDSNCIIISDKKGMEYIKEKSPIWYNSLVKNNIDSLVLFRLKSGNNNLGYIWVSNFKTDDTIIIKETLEITTFIVGSEVANHLLLNQLTELSTMDLLTGVYNRNEMNSFMERIMNIDNPVGLLFLDINGLKKINDTKGHLAGDKLIKNAARTLKIVFPNEPIFRAGGDEFVVIIDNANLDELKKYELLIKEEATKHNVSFAIGYSLSDSKNILKIFKEADENMYIDKRKHYDEIK